jgi:plastocyanin
MTRRSTARVASLAVFGACALASGCGKSERSAPAERAGAAAGAGGAAGAAASGRAVDPATVGTIRGAVLLAGTPPAPREVSFSDAACSRMHDGPVMSNEVVVRDGKLANVFVYIKSGLDGFAFPTPTEEVAIDQRGCIYEPLVVGVQVGQPLVFINSDQVLHNVHTVPKQNDSINLAMPAPGMRIRRTLDTPEVMIRTKCDVHPWMRAYIGVVAHPYFAVTGADGSFSLANVPPGEYVLEAWHEVYGIQTRTVTLAPNGTQSVEITFTPGT